jgi:hypothetical protein
MEDKKTNGYIVGGVLIFISAFFLVNGFETGWVSGKTSIITGFFFALLGGGSVWKPETIGHIVVTAVNNIAENQRKEEERAHRRTNNIKAKNNNYSERGNVTQIINKNKHYHNHGSKKKRK